MLHLKTCKVALLSLGCLVIGAYSSLAVDRPPKYDIPTKPVHPPKIKDIDRRALDVRAPWTTPGDGTLVMLARSAIGLASPIPFGMQICVTAVTPGDNNIAVYIWTTGPAVSPGGDNNQLEVNPKLGECVQIDQPAAAIVQTSTTSGIVSGYYEWIRPRVFPRNKANIVPLPQISSSAVDQVNFGAPMASTARCKKLNKPTNEFWAACKLPLPGGHRGVRVCIGSDYIDASDGKTDYAISLLDIILSEHLRTQNKPTPYDYRWNPIFPGGCRDLFFTKDAYFMVGPRTTGGDWDPSKIKAIRFTRLRLGR
jgi:hypothetical protein